MTCMAHIFVTLLLILARLAAGTHVWADSLESVLMPGKVIRGHAKTEEQCNKCHVRFNRAGQDALCGDCHKDVARDMAQKQGYHGRAREGKLCRDCHTEHKGSDARMWSCWTKKSLTTSRRITCSGASITETECSKCHRPGIKYRNAQEDLHCLPQEG